MAKNKTYKKVDLLEIAKSDLPNNFTLAELEYKLELLSKINRGLDDVTNGRVYTKEELLKMLKWHSK